jgi:hypothetical protein
MKTIMALTVAVLLALASATAAAAATGTASAQMTMGTVNIDVTSGATFNVSTPPLVYATDGNGNPIDPASWWNNQLQAASGQYSGQQLDVWTIGCWRFAASVTDSVTGVVTPVTTQPYWKCGTSDTGPATTYDAAEATLASGVLGTTGLQTCSWLTAYDITNGGCTADTGTQYEDGVYSPAVPDYALPSLDAYVGQTVVFDVVTNWCSYIAPPAPFDPRANIGYGPNDVTTGGMPSLGCSSQEFGNVVLGAARMTASTAGNPQEAKVPVKIQAGPGDCHVPFVKGLKLHKAKHRLLAHHCGVGHIHYAKAPTAGKGRVRYQPLTVGRGLPKGYRVSLTVGR